MRRFRERLDNIDHERFDISPLTDEELRIKENCQTHFFDFLIHAWPHGVPGSEYRDNWHIGFIADHLQAMYTKEILRLLINQPPRTSKSTLCSVLFPVWLWIKDPSLKIISASYAHSLAIRDSVASRRLIQSKWFKRLWQVELTADVNSKIRYDNKSGGFRLATSVGGSALGEGSHFQIIDDGNAGNESDVDRERAINWFKNVMSSRYTINPNDFRRIVVAQRLHEMDLSGFIVAQNDKRWTHLMLPMELEINRKCKTQIGSDKRKKQGDLLWPSLIDAVTLKTIKEKEYSNDQYQIAGQLQQRPSPEGGGIFKSSWVVLDENSHQYHTIISSWDTALTSNSKSAYSACTTWGVYKDEKDIDRIHLLSLTKLKIEFPELRQLAYRMSQNVFDNDLAAKPATSKYPADLVLIESKVSGFGLDQELARMKVPVYKFNPNLYGDKVTRARRVTDLFEDGKVSISGIRNKNTNTLYPDATGRKLLKELELFPHGESNDVIDSVSQALIYIKHTHLVQHSRDAKFIRSEQWTSESDKIKRFGFSGL